MTSTSTIDEGLADVDDEEDLEVWILTVIVSCSALVLLCCLCVVLFTMLCHRKTSVPPAKHEPPPREEDTSEERPDFFMRKWLRKADRTREDKFWQYGDAFEKRFPDAESLSAAVHRTSPTRVLNECGVVNVEDREVLHEALSMHAHIHVPQQIPEKEPYVETGEHRDSVPHHEPDHGHDGQPSKLREVAKDTSEGSDRIQDAFSEVAAFPPDYPSKWPRTDEQTDFPWLPASSGRGLPRQAGILHPPRRVLEVKQPPAPQWG